MKKSVILAIVVVVIILVFIYQKFFISKEPLSDIKNIGGKMEVNSVFNNNEEIPSEYTCDGENISPQLEIIEIPEQAKTLAIAVDDPDAPAGTWVHWVVWNILVEGKTKSIGKGERPGIEGKNDFKKIEYGGPCPPSGTHRYFFKVYALDSELDLKEGSTKQQLEQAMQGHILAEGELMGSYSRE